MATIDRLVGLVTRNFPRARIWLSEYGYQSNPPDRLLGISLALQARYLAEGEYVAYRTPRVDLLLHFLYRDEPELARFQSGLVTLGNKPKPALAAFEAPLAETSRTGARVGLWGRLGASAAASSTARIERRAGAAWRPLGSVRAGAGGVIRWIGPLPRGAVVRLHAGAVTGAGTDDPLGVHRDVTRTPRRHGRARRESPDIRPRSNPPSSATCVYA